MHLAYLDDSDTKQKEFKWQVMSAVIVEDSSFKFSEMSMATVIEKLVGLDTEKFVEFKACELYGGYGPFAGVDLEVRLDAMQHLLAVIAAMGIKVVYGAVNLEALKTEVYGSADPMDICFRKCLAGIRVWADKSLNEQVDAELADVDANYEVGNMVHVMLPKMLNNLVVLIVDECDGKTKSVLQRSYRNLRPTLACEGHPGITECFHDDLYFGDSKFSIGIQLADLCSYLIARHLEGDIETEVFYQIIEGNIIYPREEKNDEDNTFSRLRQLQQGHGDDSQSESKRGEISDGSGETRTGDGGGENGQAWQGPTA